MGDELNSHLAENSYQAPQDRQAHLDKRYGKGRFRVDSRNNHDNYAAVHDTHTNRVYHLHRGTSNSDDLGTDAHLAFGNLHNTSRYRTTEERVNQTHQQYANSDHTHIGHSLGGTLADTFARQHGDSSVAYNMGSSPFASKNAATEKNRHIRIGSDFVSQFQNSQGAEVHERKQDKLDQVVDKVSKPFLSGINPAASFGIGLAKSAYNTFQSHLLHNFHN